MLHGGLVAGVVDDSGSAAATTTNLPARLPSRPTLPLPMPNYSSSHGRRQHTAAGEDANTDGQPCWRTDGCRRGDVKHLTAAHLETFSTIQNLVGLLVASHGTGCYQPVPWIGWTAGCRRNPRQPASPSSGIAVACLTLPACLALLRNSARTALPSTCGLILPRNWRHSTSRHQYYATAYHLSAAHLLFRHRGGTVTRAAHACPQLRSNTRMQHGASRTIQFTFNATVARPPSARGSRKPTLH